MEYDVIIDNMMNKIITIINNLNGWQRLFMVIALFYLAFITIFILDRAPWEQSSTLSLYKAALFFPKETIKEKATSKQFTVNTQADKSFLLSLPDSRKRLPKWMVEYDKYFETDPKIAQQTYIKYLQEAKNNHNQKEIEHIIAYKDMRMEHLEIDAIIYGPSSKSWNNCIHWHPLYIEHPEFISVLKDRHMRYMASYFLEKNRIIGTIVIVFVSFATIIYCYMFYWFLPLMILYAGSIIISRIVRWIFEGFARR